MIRVYGIPNCNTVKKALDWLKEHKLSYEFHDYKKLGITEAKLQEWSKQIPWEILLNRKGITWKKLLPEQQQTITNANAAYDLMIEKPSIIKRPVIEYGDKLLTGFNEIEYAKQLEG